MCAPRRVSVHPSRRSRSTADGHRDAPPRRVGRPASTTAKRLGLGRREGEEPVADAAVEGEVELGLEAGHVAGRLARQARPRPARRGGSSGRASGRRSRRPRGRAAARAGRRRRSPGRRASSRRSARRRPSRPASSAGRMTSVTSWRRAALNRSASVSGSVGAADVGPRQEDLAEPLAEPRAARLAGDVDVETPAREVPGEGVRLRRLAGALGPLDRDEPAARPAPPGRVTRRV